MSKSKETIQEETQEDHVRGGLVEEPERCPDCNTPVQVTNFTDPIGKLKQEISCPGCGNNWSTH
jgi:uncharacterized protein with PIN domain